MSSCLPKNMRNQERGKKGQTNKFLKSTPGISKLCSPMFKFL